MTVFDATATGSPVTADQFNFLVSELNRVRRECPCVSTFSYLGDVGLTTNAKNSTEFSTSIAVPVPSIVANSDATCNVVLGDLRYSGAETLALGRSTLSWQILCRQAEGTVGTYTTEELPTAWQSIANASDEGVNACSIPITLGVSAVNKFTGAYVALRLAGDWGYSGNMPGFVAFCSFDF